MTFAIIDTPILFAVLLFFFLPVWFLWVALNKAGLAGPLALLCFVPLGFILVLGILAFSQWPALEKKGVT